MSHLNMGGYTYSTPARPGSYDDKLQEARRVLAQAQSIMEKVQVMQQQATRALWCEPGDHAFSSKDPDMRVMTISGGDMDDETVTMCGQHVPQVVRRKAKAELQDSEPHGEQVSAHGLYARA